MKKSILIFYKRLSETLVLTIALLMFSAVSMAQTTVSGKVTDSKDGSPVAGVTVTVVGTKVFTQTASDGTYKISVPAGSKTLAFTSVGFTKQDLPIGNGSVNVSFVATNQQLSEVVVIGYGTARKKDLTGAVSTVSAKDFQKGAISTPEQLIAGKIAGVSVISNGGQPGSGSQIRIRGGASINASNDPLIVLDGVLLDPGGLNGASNALSLINANDIETFTVLKDASSTAIYGSRASNGVILITTKKGKSGALKVNFSSALSVSKLIKQVSVYSADEIRALVNQSGSTFQKGLLGNANTNWQDEVYRTAISNDNNISISGGIKKLPYRVSIGYSYLNGIIQTDNLQKTSLALALNPTFLDNHLKVDINIKATAEKARFADKDAAVSGATSFDPTQPVYSGSQRFGGFFEWLDPTQQNGLRTNTAKNPVGILQLTHDDQKPTRSIGNIQVDYKLHFLPELRFNVNVGYDLAKSTGTKLISDSAASNYSKTPATLDGGSSQYGKQTKTSYFVDYYINYAKDLKAIKSRVDATVGYSYNYYESKIYNYRNLNAKGDTIPQTTPPLFEFDKQNNATIGYFARLVYSLNDKYVLTGTIRRDGSSRFAKPNRWGNFPSVAFAWRIGEEGFIKRSKVISDLKLRVGYGKTGQQEGIANYTYFYGFNQASANSAYLLGKDYIQGQAPSAYNSTLKWEITDAYNAAIDYGFFNNRITGSLDFYQKNTRDLLFRATQPALVNFSTIVLGNVASMENRGVEFNIGAAVVKKKDLNWDVNFNVSYNENKITKLTTNPDPNYQAPAYNIPSGSSTGILVQAVGKPLGSFYLYHQIYGTDGKPIEGLYEDVNRDGIINDKDQYIGKSGTPNLFFGFSTNVNYKKWSAGFVLRANFNNYVYNNVFSNKGLSSQVLGGYAIGNLSSNYSESGFKNNQGLSDFYLENGSFLRMDNLNIGYNFGKIGNSKSNLRIGFTAQNVFIITKYKGLDPEITNGIDNNLYPRPRTFTLGANLDF